MPSTPPTRPVPRHEREPVAVAIPRPPRLPTGVEPPAAKARPEPAKAPESTSSAAGLQIKVRDIKGWTALLVAVIGAITAGWAKLDAAPVTDRVEVVRENQWANKQQIDGALERLSERLDRVEAENRRLRCQVEILGSASKHQSYDPGFGSEVRWLSAYLPSDKRVRTAPAWVAAKNCER